MAQYLKPRYIAIAGAGAAAIFLFPRTTAKVAPIANVFETPAVKNVGDRYSAGGGTNTHLPAVATNTSSSEKNLSPQLKAKGPDSDHFQDTQADQKVGPSTPVGAAFHKAQYGEGNNGKGK